MPGFRSRSAGQRGFGLLELLIAMTILAVGILGIMKLQMQSSFGNTASRNTSAAVNLARSKIESLKRVGSYCLQNQNNPSIVNSAVPDLQDQNGSTSLDNWTTPDFTDPPMNESQDSSGLGKIFTRKWNIADNTPIPDFKTIRVRVEWTWNGEPRYLDLETQIGFKDTVYFN
ncbi:MAG: prepilin-type N-terminal cleavage/methylation domain-containing protein [bacterium]|nr:prepilin-type N-terminal cleavage/methylation domain-containing protein [bacterium]MDT8394973.1 prepilin-type N-terminal cleavage/methylation domain-containing protein [bacterium]